MNSPLLQAVLPTGVLLLSAGLCRAQLVVDTSLGNSPYTINANTTQTSTIVGNTAGGTLTQTAGTFNVSTLSLGETATGLGQYNQIGGTLSATNLIVGNAGTGSMQTAGTVNFETLTLGQASGSSGSYTVNGGTLISSSSNIIFGEVFRLIIGANGAAALTLSNATASTKTFSTMIASAAGSSGTLRLGSGSTLSTRSIVGGAGNSTAIFDGGTLVETYSGATILSKLTEARVSTGGLAINVASGASSTLGQTLIHDSSISGPDGGLTMTGQGTLSITTPQHYTGPTTLAAGKVSVQSNDGLGDGGVIRFTGGTLSVGYNATTAIDFSPRFSAEGNQIFRVGASSVVGITLAGDLSGSGSRFEAVGGTLVLSGTNTYTGTTTVSSGKLIATKPAALPGFATAGRVSVASGATLAVDPGAWSGAEITQLSQAVTLASGATLGWEPVGAESISEGGIGGSVPFVKTGYNVVQLRGTNTFSGGLRVSQGKVYAATPAALPGYDVAGKNIVDAGGTLAVPIGGPGQWSVEDLRTLHANTTVASSSRIAIDSTNAPDAFVLSGAFAGTGTLMKVGTNTLRLENFSTAGSLDVAEGTLSIPVGSVVNTAGLGVGSGGTLDIAGTLNCDPAKSTAIGRLSTLNVSGTLNAGTLAILGYQAPGFRTTVNQTGGSVNASGSLQIGENFNAFAVNYNISGGSITTPTLGISGINTLPPAQFSTLTLDDGTIHVTSPTDPMSVGFTNGGPGILIQNGGSIEIEGRGLGINSSTQVGFVSPSFAHLNGGVLITKSIYRVINGALDFNGGTVRAKAASTNFIDRLSPAILAGGAKVDSNGFDLTISTALRHDASLGTTPDGGLTKLGAGKLTLTGANTFTGRTTVAGGTLSFAPAAYSTLLSTANATITDAAARLELAYGTATTPADAVRQAIASGRFTAAVANPDAVLGFGDSGSVVTLRATLAGDADLNGAVDFNDFLVLQNHFGQANTRFDQGDFNFNGTTDFNDFLVLQNHFGQSISGAAVAVSAAEWGAVAAFTAVPEPAMLLPLLMAGGLLRRRRASGVIGL